MRRRIGLPIAMFMLCSAAGLWAQQTTFRTSIELVHLDAVVVDATGRAVRGLTAGDFALTDRKRPQPIATFNEVSEDLPPATVVPRLPMSARRDVATNVGAQSERLVLVVIDDLHIWKGRTEQAKALARDVITGLGETGAMAVVFTSSEGSTEVVRDRAAVLSAIDGMKARQSIRRPHQATDRQRANPIDPEAPAEVALASVAQAQETLLQDFSDNMQEFSGIEKAAAMILSEGQRRKSFVLISEGPAMRMDDVFDSSGSLSDFNFDSSNSARPKPPSFHADALRQMMRALKAANVAVYALDPRGKVDTQGLLLENFPPPPSMCATCSVTGGKEDSPFGWSNPVRQAQKGLESLAEASGGFAVTNTDDFSGGIARIVEDIGHYYLMGFYPTDTGDEARHVFELTVPGHPDYTVRFRKGYTPNAPARALAKRDPLTDLATSVMPRSDLPMYLTAQPLIGVDKKSKISVALVITAPVSQMKESDAKLRDDVTYQVMVIDEKKAKVTEREGRAATFTLSARDPSKPEPDTVTYQIPMTVDLNPGRYQLRASALSKKLSKGGSVYLDIVVPDYSTAPLAVTPIALGYADGARVAVGRTRTRTVTTPSRPGMGMPMGSSNDVTLPPAQERAMNNVNPIPFEPTLDREFANTDALRAYFQVARKDEKSTVSLSITIVGADNAPLFAVDRTIAPGQPEGVTVVLPTGRLARGAYVVRVVATDSRTVAKAETGIIIK